MRDLNKFLLLIIFVLFTGFAIGQTKVNGTVKAEDTKDAVPGVTVLVKGTTIGTITDFEGKYNISVPAGSKILVFSYIGMQTKEVEVKGGKLDVLLKREDSEIAEIYIVADRAKERETPVAFSDVKKEEIEQQLGSRDLPLVMNMTPSVYSTASGGGAGDARINVRGFNQRNVAVMINGMPVNDMENGWVYWSNWDGVADATSSIQMQRGLSAVNLATPSIGGTMNIITSPADKKQGGVAKMEYGSGNFMKMSLTGHTGMINDKFALSASLVGKQGNGVIDGTWTKTLAYYLGTTYKINKAHKLELFFVGASQRHGQNLYKQNVASYSHDYAKKIGADDSTLLKYSEADAETQYPDFSGAKGGRYYNENWGPISADYNGKQFWNGKEHNRYSKDFINERENFYHKPLANLNWYAKWTPKVKQFTTLYYSGGKGGGTGTYGDMRWNYHAGINSPSRFVSWDKTYENNFDNTTQLKYKIKDADGNTLSSVYQDKTAGQAWGILRNSRNNQTTIGAISKFQVLITDNLKAQIGVDWRTAKIEHFREVRDLLGGTFFSSRDVNGDRLIKEIKGGKTKYFVNESDFWTGDDFKRKIGDRIEYNFTNTVNWMGYFVQAEYNVEKLTAYGTFGHSFIKYTYTNHFKKGDDGKELTSETKSLPGYQIKGGLSYRPLMGFSVFGNFGYISKAPIFDNIIDDRSGVVAAEVQNEIFTAFEFGVNYQTIRKDIDVKVNYYNTSWKNRALNIGIQNQDGSEGFIFVSGMNQKHSGVEFEGNYHPADFIAIGAMASFGNWNFTNDVKGTYKDYSGGTESDESYNFYTNGLKVGDSPQTQFGGTITIVPVKGLRFQFDGRHYSNHYAAWDPFSRTNENDKEQVWKTPSYFLADMHLSYKLPLKNDKLGVVVFGHIFNLFDAMYIQDATDNSKYNGFKGYDGRFSHTVNSAEVFLGLPRTFNLGVKINF